MRASSDSCNNALTRRCAIERLKFLPRRPTGDPAALKRSLFRRSFGSGMFSIWTMLGTVTGTRAEAEPAAWAMGRSVEQNPGFRHSDRHDRYDFRSIDGVELFQAFFERKALGIRR